MAKGDKKTKKEKSPVNSTAKEGRVIRKRLRTSFRISLAICIANGFFAYNPEK
jgi:hypothetical protein